MPVVLGILLFLLNHLALPVGYLAPPEGYVGAWVYRDIDFAIYQTWIHAYQCTPGWLVPDYNAPWLTEPALLNPLCWLIARLSSALHADALVVFHLIHLALYIAAAYALFFALREFTDSLAESRWALLAAVCTVPVISLFPLPMALLFGRNAPLTSSVWNASMLSSRFSGDGFLNGILGSPLGLFGTVSTLACMGLIARYLKTGAPKFLWSAGAVAAFGALMHPFEVFAVTGGGCLALIAQRKKSRAHGLKDAISFGVPALAGLAPYVFLSLRHPWLRVAAEHNHWQPWPPIWLLLTLGLPAVFCAITLLLPWRTQSPTDFLLRCWFGAVLVGIYVPWVPWSPHLVDGFHYATALLLVRRGPRLVTLKLLWAEYRILSWTFAGVVLALSIASHGMNWITAAEGGRTAGGPSSAVAAKSELAVEAWLKRHAEASELVLAPPEDAGWLATIPMHSFASHWIFSLTCPEQLRISDKFYHGVFDRRAAAAFLREYGVRYVIVPNGSPAAQYFSPPDPATHLGDATIYVIPAAQMRPFPTQLLASR